ncbi:MAG: hypothetical protein WCP99_17620, partial [Burkholderiales bacterium]
MENSALVDALSELGLNQSELARLLSVDARTVRRWVSGMVTISGPAEIALKSWLTLNRCGLPWRPDGNDILDQELIQIAFFRAKTIDMEGILESVRARGGPAAPWATAPRSQTPLGGERGGGAHSVTAACAA